MLSRRTLPVLMGILLLSGMFLLGQDTWGPPCVDDDGDGYGSPASTSCAHPGPDCDDTNPEVYPGAPELCDGVDNQCPGDVGYGEEDEPYDGMACIPEGCFDMGDSSYGCYYDDECPVHRVCITAFAMDVHEVTNAEYAACVDGGGCTAPHSLGSYTRATYYGDPAYDDFPVIYVEWSQAEAYCRWVGSRLPTEAEWEVAARGGLAGAPFPWGDQYSCNDACYGRWIGHQCEDYCYNGVCDNDTHPVGTYAANGYGLFDMAGNVREWVNDWYQADYYSVSPTNDPPGPASGIRDGVLRGGAWNHDAGSLRAAERTYYARDYDARSVGFRCARGGAYGP